MTSGVYIRTKKNCENISKAKEGHRNSEEHNRKISKARKGIIFSEEHCKNISKSKKGKNRILREIRTCKRQECNNKFEIKITSIKRFCSRNCCNKSNKKNKPLSKETKRKIGLANTGKRHSKETIRKISSAMKERKVSNKTKKRNSKASKKLWQDPEYIRKQMKAHNVTPNKTERALKDLINNFIPNEYKFVGDGEFIIGGKCPDFINVNGQKKIIELFGNYWHSKETTGRTKRQEENQRIRHFVKYGFKTLIVWERELKNIPKLKRKLKIFNKI